MLLQMADVNCQRHASSEVICATVYPCTVCTDINICQSGLINHDCFLMWLEDFEAISRLYVLLVKTSVCIFN